MDLLDLEYMEIDEIIIKKEEFDILMKLLANLQPVLRDILYKRFFENKTFKQIGLELNRSTERIRQRYCQGLRLLRGGMVREYKIYQ